MKLRHAIDMLTAVVDRLREDRVQALFQMLGKETLKDEYTRNYVEMLAQRSVWDQLPHLLAPYLDLIEVILVTHKNHGLALDRNFQRIVERAHPRLAQDYETILNGRPDFFYVTFNGLDRSDLKGEGHEDRSKGYNKVIDPLPENMATDIFGSKGSAPDPQVVEQARQQRESKAMHRPDLDGGDQTHGNPGKVD